MKKSNKIKCNDCCFKSFLCMLPKKYLETCPCKICIIKSMCNNRCDRFNKFNRNVSYSNIKKDLKY